MKLKLGITMAAVVALAYCFATPYLAVNAMREAARQRNAAALSAYVDFPAVRQSFKDQFNSAIDAKLQPKAKDNAFAAMGAMLAGAVVDRLIDFMVTPAGIRQLMSGV